MKGIRAVREELANEAKALADSYTQERVAQAIGVSRKTYGRIEAGLVPMTNQQLAAAADYLGCKMSDLSDDA